MLEWVWWVDERWFCGVSAGVVGDGRGLRFEVLEREEWVSGEFSAAWSDLVGDAFVTVMGWLRETSVGALDLLDLDNGVELLVGESIYVYYMAY